MVGDTENWYSITSSSDGTKLAAVVSGGYIYTSTNSGVTWTEATSAGSRAWSSITSSSDGTKLAATIGGYDDDYIYTSTDSGATWTEQTSAGSRNWYSITSSSDGTKLAAVVWSGSIYTSGNSGATWTEQTSARSRGWLNVTSSTDGTKLVATHMTPGDDSITSGVATSTDGGTSWADSREYVIGESSGTYIIQANISADGTKIAVSGISNEINETDTLTSSLLLTSNDFGTTWTESTVPGMISGGVLAASFDHSKLVVAGLGLFGPSSHIYTSYIEQAPQEPSNHTILPNSEDSKSILLESPEDTTLTCSSSLKESTNTKQDTKYSYPLGLVDFCFDTTTQSNQVSLTFVTDLKPNQVVARKYNSTNGTYFDIPNATITETTLDGKHALKLTYNIEDNGTLDLDPATGSIKDPVGLAVLASEDDLASTGQSRATLLTMAIVSFIIGGFVLGRRAIGGGRA